MNSISEIKFILCYKVTISIIIVDESLKSIFYLDRQSCKLLSLIRISNVDVSVDFVDPWRFFERIRKCDRSVAMNDEGRDVNWRYERECAEQDIRLKWWCFATGTRWRVRSAEDDMVTKLMDAFANVGTIKWVLGNQFNNELLSQGRWVHQKKNGEKVREGFYCRCGCFDDEFHHLQQ